MNQLPKMASAATTKKNAARKRKNQSKITSSEPKVTKIDIKLSSNVGKAKAKNLTITKHSNKVKEGVKQRSQKKKVDWTKEEIDERFPVLKNEDLVNKFLNVTMSNNQKGRIRQEYRDNLKTTSDELLPDVIHNKMQAILNSSPNLTDTNLRKVRILYNMLKTATESEFPIPDKTLDAPEIRSKLASEKSHKKESKALKELTPEPEVVEEKKELKNKEVNKAKGPKRYVAFLGNLPLDITKEKVINHFCDIRSFIKDVRIPKPKKQDSQAAIAYLELKNEASFEMALSKHHSMLANKRINVMYTTQQNSKVSLSEAKGKASKMIALQKSGKLLGSVPANRKRSFRRNKKKQAKAREQEA